MSRVVVNEIEAKVGNDITFNDTVKISTAQIDTVRGKTTAGSITVQGEGSATTNLQQGLAKIWFALNCTGTPANRGSFNVSTVTDGGTGNMTENFTSNMNDQNYATSGIAGGNSGTWADSLDHYYVASPCQTSSIQLAVTYHTGLTDGERVSGQVSGDLA